MSLLHCAHVQMQKDHAVLNLEEDTALNQSTWMMCSVLDQKEISLSVLVELDITVVMGRMLVSSVEVKIGKKAHCIILLHFYLIIHTVCAADELLCSESTPEPVCISELQLCDGASNCPNGSDESQQVCVIPPGNCLTSSIFVLYTLTQIIFPLKNVHILEQYDWCLVMRQTLMRGEWRFATEDSGELCVMTCGIDLMLKLCVDSSDMERMVII